jgi:transcriptional regulator with GAF, ATPase, and Fis domain
LSGSGPIDGERNSGVPPIKAEGIVQLPGISDAIRTLNRRIREFAAEDCMVFITGEPGTEKALAARTIHMLSARAERPISKISVTWKLPSDTAARFRACDRGSLIVNLQREFPVDMQYTVLEMANDKAFADAMSGDLVEADVRILLTTSLSLDKLNGSSALLPELNDLLGRCHLEIPPIRERPEDIPALVRYATQRAIETGRSRAQGANPQVLHLFRQWHWPGNAEDLLLVTAEAALNTTGNVITLDDLPTEFMKQIPPALVETAREVKVSGSRPISTVDEETGSGSSDEERTDATGAVSLAARQPPPKATPKPAPPRKEPLPVGDFHEEKTDPAMGSLIEEIEARRRAKDQPPPVEEEITAPDLQELAAAAQRELAAIKANEARELQTPEEVEQQTRRLQRLFILARRLNAQSQILARQMSGPLRHRRVDVGYSSHESEQDNEQLSEALETELDKGLDAILALRRQLAILNQREIQANLTARDLYRRLILAGQDIRRAVEDDEIKGEATVFSHQLKAVEEAISRIRTSFPDIEGGPARKDPTEDLRRDEIEQVQRILKDAEWEGR